MSPSRTKAIECNGIEWTKSEEEKEKALAELYTQHVAAIVAAYKVIKWDDETRWRGKNHLNNLIRKHDLETLLRAVRNYGVARAGEDPKFCRGLGNFFGRDKDWVAYAAQDWELKTSGPPCEIKEYDPSDYE